eukprot:SM000179S03396  [mRNA]  locus=s179:67585:69392:- [translate_table: standard]
MRRSSSRKGVAPAPGAAAGPGRASSKEQDRVDAFFLAYADDGKDAAIGPDGVEALCQDLGVAPTDIRILLLAWKLQASQMGYFTLDEWRRGMKALRADSIDKLRKALPTLQHEVANAHAFKDFYAFAFQYCLTEPRQKTLDLESAAQMLQLEQTEYKAMNLDQWMAFLRFCDEVKADISNYDENMAWPLLLDNYVEWSHKMQQR